MKIVIAYLFPLHLSLVLSKDYTNYKLFRCIPHTDKEIDDIKHLVDSIDVDFWTQPGAVNMPVDMLIKPQDEETFRRIMDSRHYSYNIIIPNVQRLFDEQTVKYYIRKKMDTFDWEHYYHLKDIYQWMHDLAELRPGELSVETIGRTVQNRTILALHVHLKGSQNRSTVIIEGGAHAREWIAPAFVTYMINVIVKSSKHNNAHLKSIAYLYEWYFIPVLNPDGYEYTHTTDRLWRKNRRDGTGVDINRNFDVAFGGPGSSKVRYRETYCGPEAFSEAESEAIRELVRTNAPRLEYYLSFHSYGQVAVIPLTNSNLHFYNYYEVKDMLLQATKKISERYRTVYQVGTLAETLGYLASGVSVCWVKAKYLVPYVALFELPDAGTHGFALPVHRIIPVCQETMDGVISFLTPRTSNFQRTFPKNYVTPRPGVLFPIKLSHPHSQGPPACYLDSYVFIYNIFILVYCSWVD